MPRIFIHRVLQQGAREAVPLDIYREAASDMIMAYMPSTSSVHVPKSQASGLWRSGTGFQETRIRNPKEMAAPRISTEGIKLRVLGVRIRIPRRENDALDPLGMRNAEAISFGSDPGFLLIRSSKA